MSGGSASEIILCFLFIGLLFGAALIYAPSRIQALSNIPYTVLVFLVGVVFGIIAIYDHNKKDHAFEPSLLMWNKIQPHLIIFVFIPALLFGEVTNLNIYHIRGTISNACLLAGPGAVLGAVLLGYYMESGWLPFKIHWSGGLCFLFSSIVSATDPVAVVALLNKTNGTSQRMKYVIVGEALLNDATALVLFNVFLAGQLKHGEVKTPFDVFIYFIEVIFISPAVGAAMGCLAVLVTNLASRKFKEEDSIVQIAVPICCAYLSFFVGEFVLHVSGILCCCSAGLMFAWLAPSLFVHHSTLHSIWGAIEWIGNTLLFLLAGMLITTRVLQHVTIYDFVNLIVIFIVVFLIRFFTLFISYPLLKRMGKGLSFGECMFTAFGGLRGAIAISLVLTLVQEQSAGETKITDLEGHQVFFYVGGLAALTLMINATLADRMLVWLGLTEGGDDANLEIDMMRHYARKRVIKISAHVLDSLPRQHAVELSEHCKLLDPLKPENSRLIRRKSFSAHIIRNLDSHSSSGLTAQTVAQGLVRRNSKFLQFAEDVDDSEDDEDEEEEGEDDVEEGGDLNRSGATQVAVNAVRGSVHVQREGINRRPQRRRSTTLIEVQDNLMTHVRNSFLEVVRTYYWKCVHSGRLPRNSPATRTLLASVDVGMETIHTAGLQDFDFLAAVSNDDNWLIKTTEQYFPVSSLQMQIHHEETQVYILTTFISAHHFAQQKIPFYLGEEECVDTVEQALVIAESKSLVIKAEDMLEKIDEEIISLVKSKQVIRTVQHAQEELITQIMDQGILKEHDVEILYEEVQHDKQTAERIFKNMQESNWRSKHLTAVPVTSGDFVELATTNLVQANDGSKQDEDEDVVDQS